eukprot:2089358-Pyramimonas_sp.AAC.1
MHGTHAMHVAQDQCQSRVAQDRRGRFQQFLAQTFPAVSQTEQGVIQRLKALGSLLGWSLRLLVVPAALLLSLYVQGGERRLRAH